MAWFGLGARWDDSGEGQGLDGIVGVRRLDWMVRVRGLDRTVKATVRGLELTI